MRKTPVDVPYESRYQNLLAQQENRLQQAWKSVLSVFPDMDWDKFSLNWLILNTRSFYYVAAGEKRPEDWNDAIGLVPFADYFNHSDAGVSVFSPPRAVPPLKPRLTL
jgi:rhamnogalacturonyl hydrolase YesR